MLVVTHDANVVVNGDAELVTAFIAVRGETRKGCEGGLQEPSVREEICTIPEGGREAFERRYQWIALGDGNV